MRILALTWKHPDDPSAGGAERYLVEVARRWVDAGHEVTILGPRRPPSVPENSLGAWERIRYIGSGSRLTVFRSALAHLRNHGAVYDLVLETVSTRPFLAHRVVGGKATALYHQTAEEVWQEEFPWPLALLGRYLLEPHWVRSMRGARVVANSRSTADALRRFGVECIGVVPPGCDQPTTPAKAEGPSSPPRLLWIGRMVRTKRPEDALAAQSLIREHLPGATLEMVGTGYLRARLAARDLPGVTFRGAVPESQKRSLLARSDLLLLPGTREGWGIVAMEAAAHGVPVIAYDIPGLRDSVVDGVTGVLVSPKPEAMADAARALLSDPVRWRLLRVAARERAMEFTWERAAKDLLSRRAQAAVGLAEVRAADSSAPATAPDGGAKFSMGGVARLRPGPGPSSDVRPAIPMCRGCGKSERVHGSRSHATYGEALTDRCP